MILHAASIAAFFVQQASQTQCIAKCVQAAPESWLKWLLPTIVQTVISLASITAGVVIAVWSFRRTKELTEWSFRATSKKDREQWLCDQKKAEWQELLRAAAHMRRMLSLGLESPQTRAKLIREGLKPAVQELEASAANCVFLSDFFVDEVKSKRFYSFLYDADFNAEKIDASFIQTQLLRGSNSYLTDQQKENDETKNILERGDLADTIAKEFIGFNAWLRKEAVEDLGIASPEK